MIEIPFKIKVKVKKKKCQTIGETSVPVATLSAKISRLSKAWMYYVTSLNFLLMATKALVLKSK